MLLPIHLFCKHLFGIQNISNKRVYVLTNTNTTVERRGCYCVSETYISNIMRVMMLGNPRVRAQISLVYADIRPVYDEPRHSLVKLLFAVTSAGKVYCHPVILAFCSGPHMHAVINQLGLIKQFGFDIYRMPYFSKEKFTSVWLLTMNFKNSENIHDQVQAPVPAGQFLRFECSNLNSKTV